MTNKKLYFKYSNEIGDDEVGRGEVWSYGAVNSLKNGIVSAAIFYSFGGVYEFNANFMFSEDILDTLEEIGEDEFKSELTKFISNFNVATGVY